MVTQGAIPPGPKFEKSGARSTPQFWAPGLFCIDNGRVIYTKNRGLLPPGPKRFFELWSNTTFLNYGPSGGFRPRGPKLGCFLHPFFNFGPGGNCPLSDHGWPITTPVDEAPPPTRTYQTGGWVDPRVCLDVS
jgi:hypothetical protein